MSVWQPSSDAISDGIRSHGLYGFIYHRTYRYGNRHPIVRRLRYGVTLNTQKYTKLKRKKYPRMPKIENATPHRTGPVESRKYKNKPSNEVFTNTTPRKGARSSLVSGTGTFYPCSGPGRASGGINIKRKNPSSPARKDASEDISATQACVSCAQASSARKSSRQQKQRAQRSTSDPGMHKQQVSARDAMPAHRGVLVS